MDVIDFSDAQLRNDPHPIFECLRRTNPICPVRGMRAYLVTRYHDCAHFLKDERIGFEDLTNLSHVPDALRGYYEMRRRLMLFQNPPEHEMTRKSGKKKLQEPGAAEVERVIRESAERFLGRLAGRECELISEISRPFVAEVIVNILGLRGVDLAYVTELAQELADSLDPLSDLNSRTVAGERYLALKDHAGSACPHGGEADLSTLVMLVAAGLQTTSHILGLAVYSVLSDGGPEAMTPEVLEELYRFHSPAQLTRRVVREEVTVRGKRLRPGTVLWLALASANRDESVFEKPYELNFSRPANRHLAFGVGAHHCIGAKLARTQLRIFLQLFLERKGGLSLKVNEAVYNGNLLFKGLAELPLMRKK